MAAASSAQSALGVGLRPLAIITLKDRFLAPVAQTFIDSAHAAARSLWKK